MVKINSGDLLSPEQRQKHIKVYAGPGAGKTHFLVENIKNIVRTDDRIAKSKNRQILCITYTNAAVGEITSRLDKFSSNVYISTIHGFIIEHIIKPFQAELKKIILEDFNITIKKSKKITSQIEGLGILHGIDKNEIFAYIDKTNASTLTYSKKIMAEVEVKIDEYIANSCSKIYIPSKIDINHIIPIKKYIWDEVGKLTHNEILYFGYRIIQRYPLVLYSLRVKFPFIFIDEFQDTNPLQVLILKHIAKKSTTIGVIGDVAQSIYSFQGAVPTQFSGFISDNSYDRELVEYYIEGNRRSTANIVSFCNWIRQKDTLKQESIKEYSTETDKKNIEATPVCFLLGNSKNVDDEIRQIVSDGGVVLTRSWAATFNYIDGISNEQKENLKNIYNSYYNSPVDLRAEISEHNNITWVRAFRFILNLQEAHSYGSVVDIFRAFYLYLLPSEINTSVKFIFELKKILCELFNDIKPETSPVSVIELFNDKIKHISCKVDSSQFDIPVFSEYDDRLKSYVQQVNWNTAHKLFTEVFSNQSRYMTVHQAKGLEWNKVIVSLIPNRFDETSIDKFYASPCVMRETSADEFARMYYVACSRAKEQLFIHIPQKNGDFQAEIIRNLSSLISTSQLKFII